MVKASGKGLAYLFVNALLLWMAISAVYTVIGIPVILLNLIIGPTEGFHPDRLFLLTVPGDILIALIFLYSYIGDHWETLREKPTVRFIDRLTEAQTWAGWMDAFVAWVTRQDWRGMVNWFTKWLMANEPKQEARPAPPPPPTFTREDIDDMLDRRLHDLKAQVAVPVPDPEPQVSEVMIQAEQRAHDANFVAKTTRARAEEAMKEFREMTANISGQIKEAQASGDMREAVYSEKFGDHLIVTMGRQISQVAQGTKDVELDLTLPKEPEAPKIEPPKPEQRNHLVIGGDDGKS